MDLQKLRVFAAVARESNVTRAAQKLSLSQPALSKQLAELEDSLSVALFDRLPRGVRLTAAGEVLARHAERIFAAERAAEAELGELLGLRSGRLSIGASTTIGSYLIPTAFGAFHEVHPQVRLELEIANSSVIQAMVADGRVDLGLTEGVVPGEQFAVEIMHYDEMVAFARKGHPLLQKKRIHAADLLRAPFICRERGSGTREVLEAAFAERGLRIEPVMSLGSNEAIKNAVAAGWGVAMLSRLTLDLELSSGRVELLDVRDLSIRRALYAVRLRGKRDTLAVEAFMGELRRVLITPAGRVPESAGNATPSE